MIYKNIIFLYIIETSNLFFSYHKQASADAEAVWRRTLQLLRQLGRPSDSILEKDVKMFCRHATDIHVERGSCIADEYDPKVFDTNTIGNYFHLVLQICIIIIFEEYLNYNTHSHIN